MTFHHIAKIVLIDSEDFNEHLKLPGLYFSQETLLLMLYKINILSLHLKAVTDCMHETHVPHLSGIK